MRLREMVLLKDFFIIADIDLEAGIPNTICMYLIIVVDIPGPLYIPCVMGPHQEAQWLGRKSLEHPVPSVVTAAATALKLASNFLRKVDLSMVMHGAYASKLVAYIPLSTAIECITCEYRSFPCSFLHE